MIKSTLDNASNYPNDLPIGIFDSGLGGLTIAHEISKILPNESILYFADSANLPYGDKTSEEIVYFTTESINFLKEQGVKAIVIACHTASVHIREKVQSSIPILNLFDCTCQETLRICKKSLGILGTTATIQSQAYQLAHEKHFSITSVASPKLVPMIEAQEPGIRSTLNEYLTPFKANQVDAILLACTHYHYLTSLIAEEMGPQVSIIDTSVPYARYLAKYLKNSNLLASGKIPARHQHIISDAKTPAFA